MEDIEPKNQKNQFHGYQEWYSYEDIWYRGIFKHGMEFGYEEYHQDIETNFYIR
jgi:hypothetical protein